MNSHGQGKLIIVSAPSGAGKTTLVKHLLASGLNLGFSVSATSRLMRKGEQDGVDYHFLAMDEFQRKIEKGDFVEWEEVYKGTYYGTLRSEVDERLMQGKNIVFDVDVKGGINIKSQYGDRALSIFVSPPSLEELERRLRTRSSDPESSIRSRIEKAAFEMGFSESFDVCLVNDDLEKARLEILSIVRNFLSIN